MRISTPFINNDILKIRAGESVLLSGVIYTARDAAHQLLLENLKSGLPLPFDIAGAAIYYAGPCPKKPGQIINSCGPTTSGRMDFFAPALFDLGLKCTIGKGPVHTSVIDSIKKNRAIYLCATGGAGALIAECVKSFEILAFEELGTEAVCRLEVENFPLIAGVDSRGVSAFV